MFADRLELAERYADLLATEGTVRGLIGPREVPRLWDRHLLNCVVVEELIERDLEVCDVGTGAGLPGLVLALHRPDLRVTLLEPLLRRTTFLQEAVAELGLTNAEVMRGRAEELHGLRDFDVVTSRAVAPLGRLLEWSMPMVRQGGLLLAMKGASAADEVRDSARELRTCGARSTSVRRVGVGAAEAAGVSPTTVVRVVAGRPSRLGLSPSTKTRGKSRGRRRRGSPGRR